MPTIVVLKPFRYALRGVQIVDIAAGAQNVSDEIADVAIAEGWAQPVGGEAETKPSRARRVSNKARLSVPEVQS